MVLCIDQMEFTPLTNGALDLFDTYCCLRIEDDNVMLMHSDHTELLAE